MAEPAAETVLLIYPVGNSDINLDGQSSRFLGSFRHLVESLNAATFDDQSGIITDSGLMAITVTRNGEPSQELTFPMVDPVLRFIRGKPGYHATPIQLRFIVTNQKDKEHQGSDTVGFDRLFARFLATLPDNNPFGPVAVLDAIPLDKNPASHDDTVALFQTKVVPTVHQDLESCQAAFYSSAAGTPAIVFAAAMTLGPDSRIEFIYKPNTAPLVPPPERQPSRPFTPPTREEVMRVLPIAGFRKLPQQRTLNLLDAALAQFDFTVAVDLLTNNGSGFPPKEVAATATELGLYRDWRGEYFREGGGTGIQWGVEAAGLPVRQLMQRLATIPSEPKRWPEFWQHKLVDVALRLDIARAVRDVPGFVDRIKLFVELNLIWGLCRFGLTRGARCSFEQIVVPADYRSHAGWEGCTDDQISQKMKSGREHFALLRWAVNRADPAIPGNLPAKEWFARFATFDKLVNQHLRRYRNQHMHNAAMLERTLLDDVAKKIIAGAAGGHAPAIPPDQVDKLGGATLLFGLVMDVVRALPATPANGPAAADVEDLIQRCLSIPEHLAKLFTLAPPPTAAGLRQQLLTPDDATQTAIDTFVALVSRSRPRSQGATRP